MEAAQPLVWNARKPQLRRTCCPMPLLVASLVGAAPPGARAEQAQAPIPREFQDTSHTARVLSDFQEKVGDMYRLAGHVEVTYRQMKVTADEATFDDSSGEVVARGHVTTCPCEKKGWSVATREARVKVGDKVVSHGDVFRLLGVPLFYAPALVHSISREPRQSGFLLPQIGNSTQKGYILGDGFFWAVNPSLDLMAGLAEYSKRGVATTGRIRARPRQTSDLTADYFSVNDKGHTTCPASAAALGT